MRHVQCSNTSVGRLNQLEPCIEDWHCVINFMIVSHFYMYVIKYACMHCDFLPLLVPCSVAHLAETIQRQS